MNARERLRALNTKVLDENETYLRRLDTRRWRAWWALQAKARTARTLGALFLKRDHHWIIVGLLACFAAVMWMLGASWYSQVVGFAIGVYVLWTLDRADQRAEAAQRSLAIERALHREKYATLQDSVPMLATAVVEEQMEALGFRRKPVLLMADVAYDAETGDPIDMRDPTKMWEKI